MDITIIPNDNTNAPAGKLADAELHFTDGALEGLKLIGFAVWEGRGGATGRGWWVGFKGDKLPALSGGAAGFSRPDVLRSIARLSKLQVLAQL